MIPDHPHTIDKREILDLLSTSIHGLDEPDVANRRKKYGLNELPRAKPLSLTKIFLDQFLSPLIYILLLAAIASLVLEEYADAIFIFAVLLVNSIIGTIQEYSAQRSSITLQNLVTENTRVLRSDDVYEINSKELVPGDIVLLESGTKVPADMRLIYDQSLAIDESLLTGESSSAAKNSDQILAPDTALADRLNMAFAGTLVTHGRAQGVIINTGLNTELGQIATGVLIKAHTKPPLLLRMEKFTLYIALSVVFATVLLFFAAFSQGIALHEIFFLSVALAVSAIPEGLPVALTVALAVGMRRMARRNVIVRRLLAVEALGSCTYIASDKTGTLTVNELTARKIFIPGEPAWEITGAGAEPVGEIITPNGPTNSREYVVLERLGHAIVFANEGLLARRDGSWTHHGDAVDVALLVMAHKVGVIQPETLSAHPQIAMIPFEPEIKFAASLNRFDDKNIAFVKGALECVLPMCSLAATIDGDKPVMKDSIMSAGQTMASEGYRVLAIATGEIIQSEGASFSKEHLNGLTLLGLIGMIDPLRHEAKQAIQDCRGAGIEVCMITGDHPLTAFTIASELGLASSQEQVVTGTDITEALRTGPEELDAITQKTHVFARIEPQQKLLIVQSLQRNGHFVAVTGDGANDAPAMRASHVGVSMGKSGTDVARETSDLIITDDNFASIVDGIEEGRIAYANVRKVIFLLISTGAAEIVLFILALLSGLPLPLLAVQLLWLNLVTNGIQDVALAFEPAEGHELKNPPRPPGEPIFNRIMIERIIISALVMGTAAFAIFYYLINNGYAIDEARNGTLLLMVLFENVHVFNCRSETRSTFLHNPLRNRILLFGTLTAQLIHIGAMYTPGLNDILGIQPVSPAHWLQLLTIALLILAVMEIHKLFRNRLIAK
jgi:magnesium-transporting ATPase (P-type)